MDKKCPVCNREIGQYVHYHCNYCNATLWLKNQPEEILNLSPKRQVAKMDEAKQYHGHPRFYEIVDELKGLHSRKNADYAKVKDPLSNLRQSEKIGIPAWKGCLVRMGDKWDRLVGFAEKGILEVADETVIDTLNDLAVYAVLCRILYEEGIKDGKGENLQGSP